MTDLRCVIFDVDGTLVDSQNMIIEAFRFTYARHGIEMPPRAALLACVGMSLDLIFPVVSPQLNAASHAALAQGYRDAYADTRATKGTVATSPFFAGARAALDDLHAQDWTLLAVATGKSRRGLTKLVEGHDLTGYFQSTQTADEHPSKPNPAMILAVLAETGIAAHRTVIVGDTSFDMDMGQAAGVRRIGVSWGYHNASALNADLIIDDFDALLPAIDKLIGPAT